MRPKPDHRSRSTIWLGCFFLLVILASGTAAAQEAPQPETSLQSDVTIHVVQRGETLFRIAQNYGTTVEALQAANNILDPTRIEVGQRLIIPGDASIPSVALQAIIMQPSDSLHTLALRLGTSPEQLATINRITNPDLMFAGQRLEVAAGQGGTSAVPSGTFHVVQPGEVLLRIAASHGVAPSTLFHANSLDSAAQVYPGKRLILPGDGPTVGSLVSPWSGMAIRPLPVEQGRTIAVRVETDRPGSLSGKFLFRDLIFVSEGQAQTAIIGVDAFTRPGIYPLTLTFVSEDGSMSTFERGVFVADGRYASETIDVPNGLEGLLDERLLDSEYALVSDLMSNVSPQRLWNGLFLLPTGGDVASAYGTRREYQSADRTLTGRFHSGADFAMPVGTPIQAPAAGHVVFAGPMEVRGNATIIDHGWGVHTGYWHQAGILVQAGDQVQAGQQIGSIGSTGLVTGAHLHWEMWVSGVEVDPMQWVREELP